MRAGNWRWIAKMAGKGLAGIDRRFLWTLAVLLAVVLVSNARPATAAAAECTDNYTGTAEGAWTTASNWSAGHVPGIGDVACIASGKSAKFSNAGKTNQVAVVQGEGSLNIQAGSLELTRLPSEGQSTLALLTMGGGTLTGAGKITVTKVLSWNNGTMSGAGSAVVAAGATGTITNAHINEHTLVNEGSLSLPSKYLAMSEGARLENSGTFTINTEGGEFGLLHPTGGAAPLVVNTGTIRKTAGVGESVIKPALINYGTIKAESGTIGFPAPEAVTLLSSSVLEGAINLHGPSVTAGAFSMPSGTLTLQNGSLSVESGYAAHVAELALKGGTLKGGGVLNIASGLTWTGGTMAGVGSTLISPSATATASNVSYDERTLVNEGAFTVSGNYLSMGPTAVLENAGTLTVNGEGAETGIIHPAFKTGAILANTGTVRKTSGAGTTSIRATLANLGVVRAETGTLNFTESGLALLDSGSSLVGAVKFQVDVLGESFTSTGGPMTINGLGSLTIPGGAAAKTSNLNLTGTTVKGSGRLEVSSNLTWENSTMEGSGKTVLGPGAIGSIYRGKLDEWTFLNEGTMSLPTGYLLLRDEATFENEGTFNANTEGGEYGITEGTGGTALFLNTGLFQKTAGTGTTEVEAPFNNSGVLKETSGHLDIKHPVKVKSTEAFGNRSCSGDPVECATGNFSEVQTDFDIKGRGVGLRLTRTYSAQAAASAVAPGAFGYGWTASFADNLAVEESGAKVTLIRGNGSTVPFTRTAGTTYAAPAWSQETLSGSPEAGYVFTDLERSEYRFSGAGRLEAISDRNGNETTLGYGEAGRLVSITDPSGRQLTLTYNAGGQVETATDPMGHVVKYGYEGGNLTTVTMPGETSPRWQFKYDGSHRITQVTDGRGGKTSNEYDSANRVTSQTDPAGRTLTFKYEAFHTTVTNKATGAITDKWFTSDNEPFQITYGYGTAQATTETFSYNGQGRLTRRTDGNGHSTTYGYDAEGNRTSERNADGDEAKWTYNGAHEVASETTPTGETTTIKRDSAGNVESITRPAPGGASQITGFKYAGNGELEAVVDPLGHTWSYGYDSYGDRTSEIDPLGHTRTLGYDKDSRLLSIVSPRGNLEGAEPAQYATAIERDAQGRPLKVTDPLGHATQYAYDGDGNLVSVIDAKGHTTKYTYNADNERTKIEKPDGAILETAYDGAGRVSSQTDADKHTTTYVRNLLEQPVEVIDALGRVRATSFDAAGNPIKVIDAAGRETVYSYDAANRLLAVNYSEEATPDGSYEYNADGALTAMNDGTGKSTFAYDQLGRLIESRNGHGEVVKYSYNLGEEQTGIVYPNSKEVARAYDQAGQMESVTDWLGGKTSFGYDADGNLTGIAFPSESGNADEYRYDRSSRITEVKFKKGAETLASLVYSRDPLGQVEAEARQGLPGPEEVSYGYDEANRLVKAGAESFGYDPADNLTKGIGSTNTYDAASQLESGTGLTYTYDKLGERAKATPTSGPATNYGYDQAGDLASVSRPKEGEAPTISQTLAYDASGLLASKTAGLTTQHLAWDTSAEVPTLLSDGQRNFVYGPDGLAIEQINSAGAPTYLHHDQLGSTRLLTGAEGESSATFSYSPYGGLEATAGTATIPLGFAGQYTDTESGLQYLRARFYDPATGQFLTRDPIEELTREPYSYAQQNPLNVIDPRGLAGELTAGGCVAGEVIDPLGGCAPGAATGAAAETIAAAGAGILSWLAAEASDSEGSSGDEGEPCLEPAADPWVRDKEIGDRAQTHTEAKQFLEQIDISAGSNPENPYGNGPRWKQIAAAIARLIGHLANPRG
jgi:RHS repeat-associated protein